MPTASTSYPGLADPLPRLRVLMAESGSSRNDQAIAVIAACIGDGVDQGGRIVDMLVRLGFNAQHAGMMLAKNTGRTAALGLWSRDEGGRYLLHG